jgi:hypothetical protein
MRQMMLAVSTEHFAPEVVHVALPTPVADIWSISVLSDIDKIYANTLHPVISQDGLFTSAFIKAWKAYRQQVTNYFLQVFGDISNIDPAGSDFDRAASHVHSNALRLMPLEISPTDLPWPILTDGVMKDFTDMFREVEGGVELVSVRPVKLTFLLILPQ